jgi:hypothetical protein
VLPKPGTLAVVAAPLPNDLYFEAYLTNPDNDGMGVVFRFRDAANHYRFSWDAERRYRRLAKVVNGTWTVLQEDATPFVPQQTYRVATQVDGARIRVFIDGALWADRNDASHQSGSVGLYSWGSLNLYFDDALCLKPLTDPSIDPRSVGAWALRPVMTAQLRGLVTEVVGRHPGSVGDDYFLALSFARSPGIPLALLDPKDPRTLSLSPDALFSWSLQPNPMLGGFRGTIDRDGYLRARILWPKLPGTSGSIVHCGGWIMRRNATGVSQVLPSVQIVFP